MDNPILIAFVWENPSEYKGLMKSFFFLFSEIRTCFEKLDQDVDCRVVVLTGAGKAFSSGSTFLCPLVFRSIDQSLFKHTSVDISRAV